MMDLSPQRCAIAHVGLPKTGSTYLQKHYFSLLQRTFWSTQQPFSWPHELNFLYAGNQLWYQDLIYGDSTILRDERSAMYAAATRALVPNWRKNACAFARSTASLDSWLLSAEGLCGLSTDITELHMTLLKDAGVSKVLFVCRQQTNWALSLWRQFLLAEDRFARYIPFEELFGTDREPGVVDLDWNQYIKIIDAQFGAKNVLVLPYEFLITDSIGFYKQLNSFFGVSEEVLIAARDARENPSRTDSVYRGLSIDREFPFSRLPRLRRQLHRLSQRHPRFIPECLKMESLMSVPGEINALFKRRFRDSNLCLGKRINFDLGVYGYY
jgi:hypothetical protein